LVSAYLVISTTSSITFNNELVAINKSRLKDYNGSLGQIATKLTSANSHLLVPASLPSAHGITPIPSPPLKTFNLSKPYPSESLGN